MIYVFIMIMIFFIKIQMINCSHGTTKVVAGLGLLGLGALTGNQDVTNLGSAVTTLGIGTKVAAHLFG